MEIYIFRCVYVDLYDNYWHVENIWVLDDDKGEMLTLTTGVRWLMPLKATDQCLFECRNWWYHAAAVTHNLVIMLFTRSRVIPSRWHVKYCRAWDLLINKCLLTYWGWYKKWWPPWGRRFKFIFFFKNLSLYFDSNIMKFCYRGYLLPYVNIGSSMTWWIRYTKPYENQWWIHSITHVCVIRPQCNIKYSMRLE